MNQRQPKWFVYSKAAEEFERYALALLRAEANEQDKVLLTGNEISSEFAFADAVAPQGLFDLQGPVFVEIKVRYSERLIEYLERIRSHAPEIGSFVFIFREGKIPRERIAELFRTGLPSFGLHILGKRRTRRPREEAP